MPLIAASMYRLWVSSGSPGRPRLVSSTGPTRLKIAISIPTLLPEPDCVVAEIADRLFGKLLLRRLQLLQADNVRLRFLEPAQEDRQPAVHAVHIVGCDLHGVFRSGRTWSARPQPESAFD